MNLIRVSISVEQSALNPLLSETFQCDFFDINLGTKTGSICFEQITQSEEYKSVFEKQKSIQTLKRPIVNNDHCLAKAKVSKLSRNVKDPNSPRHNIHQIFKEMNILPELPNGLQCALCPYKATQKGNLKVHYQMKHLGGVGISEMCTICKQTCANRSSLKRHMMKTHNLTSEQSAKLMS